MEDCSSQTSTNQKIPYSLQTNSSNNLLAIQHKDKARITKIDIFSFENQKLEYKNKLELGKEKFNCTAAFSFVNNSLKGSKKEVFSFATKKFGKSGFMLLSFEYDRLTNKFDQLEGMTVKVDKVIPGKLTSFDDCLIGVDSIGKIVYAEYS